MTTGTVLADPVLISFREALNGLYGDRIDRIVLFRPRARRDAHIEPDWDVAEFLREHR